MKKEITENTINTTIAMGKMLLQFGLTDRVTFHEDGKTPESDTDHTVMLGIMGSAFAARFMPELDTGAIAEFSLVHDLVEVYAGDVNTLQHLSDAERELKSVREQKALERIHREFDEEFPWLAGRIEEYEQLASKEARFVKAFDKVLPKVTHYLNNAATLRATGMEPKEARDIWKKQGDTMEETYAHDLPLVMELREKLMAKIYEEIHKGE